MSAPTRPVPEDRIKTLTASCAVHADIRLADDMARRELAHTIAAELVAKLFEFSKVAKHKDGEVVVYSVALDVIVPPALPRREYPIIDARSATAQLLAARAAHARGDLASAEFARVKAKADEHLSPRCTQNVTTLVANHRAVKS